MQTAWTILVSVLAIGPVASACSCVSSSGCAGPGGGSNAVFHGMVLSVADLPSTGKFAFLSSRMARFRVDEPFGGLPPGTHEVDIATGLGGGDCGIPFKPGERYLVDAFLDKDGKLHAGTCSATRRSENAVTALRSLRRRREGQALPSLTGQIAQYDRNFKGVLGSHAPKPLADTLVRVKAKDGSIYEARADAGGLYEFFNLPPGQYEFVPVLPPGTTVAWYIGSDTPLRPFTLHGGCEERNIEVFAAGSVQGRVVDSSNKPLRDASVYILPVEEELKPNRKLYSESQGKEGFFKFVHLPPGQYLVLVNPADNRNPHFPYARTFYPGVRDREAATIITVSPGEEVKDIEIRLEQLFEPRHLTVRVTWGNGRLIRDLVFVNAKGTTNPSAMARTQQPDMKTSIVNLSILPNEPYEIGAELICRYFDNRSSGPGATLKSNTVLIGPREDGTELSLTIPGTACPDVPGKTTETER